MQFKTQINHWHLHRYKSKYNFITRIRLVCISQPALHCHTFTVIISALRHKGLNDWQAIIILFHMAHSRVHWFKSLVKLNQQFVFQPRSYEEATVSFRYFSTSRSFLIQIDLSVHCLLSCYRGTARNEEIHCRWCRVRASCLARCAVLSQSQVSVTGGHGTKRS